MALTAFLGKEKVYTRQDMGIKKAPTRVPTGQKKNVSPLLERAFNFLSFTLRTPTDGLNGKRLWQKKFSTQKINLV